MINSELPQLLNNGDVLAFESLVDTDMAGILLLFSYPSGCGKRFILFLQQELV